MRGALKKFIVLAVLLCFIIGVFLSESFFVIYSNHEHDHNGIDGNCAVCAQLQNCDNLIKQIKISGDNIVFAFVNLFVVTAFFCCVLFLFKSDTLLKLKIRMNN